jgi:hypothetical protein
MIKKLIDTIGDPIPPAQNIDNPHNRHQKDQCVQRPIRRESRHFHVLGKKSANQNWTNIQLSKELAITPASGMKYELFLLGMNIPNCVSRKSVTK